MTCSLRAAEAVEEPRFVMEVETETSVLRQRSPG